MIFKRSNEMYIKIAKQREPRLKQLCDLNAFFKNDDHVHIVLIRH